MAVGAGLIATITEIDLDGIDFPLGDRFPFCEHRLPSLPCREPHVELVKIEFLCCQKSS